MVSASTLGLCWSTDARAGGAGAEFSFDPDLVLKKFKNFFLAESLESVDTCLCLTGTGADGGIADCAREEGVLSISES